MVIIKFAYNRMAVCGSFITVRKKLVLDITLHYLTCVFCSVNTIHNYSVCHHITDILMSLQHTFKAAGLILCKEVVFLVYN